MSASDTIVHGVADVSRSALLQVRSLGKRYGDQHALFDISFEARACEVIGLIGPNGAGKTTLLEALAGVLPADQGEVLWSGAPLPLHRRREVSSICRTGCVRGTTSTSPACWNSSQTYTGACDGT